MVGCKWKVWQKYHVNRGFHSGEDIEESDWFFLRLLLAFVGNNETDDQASVTQLHGVHGFFCVTQRP